jgi:hypothetical protein
MDFVARALVVSASFFAGNSGNNSFVPHRQEAATAWDSACTSIGARSDCSPAHIDSRRRTRGKLWLDWGLALAVVVEFFRIVRAGGAILSMGR